MCHPDTFESYANGGNEERRESFKVDIKKRLKRKAPKSKVYGKR